MRASNKPGAIHLEAFYDQALPMELMAREQKHLEQNLAQVERRLKAFEGDSLQQDETLEAALALARDCYSTYIDAPHAQKRHLNQVFFQKILVSAHGDKEHHAHGHLDPWTLLFRTTNVVENQAVGLDHSEEPEDDEMKEDMHEKAEREPDPKT